MANLMGPPDVSDLIKKMQEDDLDESVIQEAMEAEASGFADSPEAVNARERGGLAGIFAKEPDEWEKLKGLDEVALLAALKNTDIPPAIIKEYILERDTPKIELSDMNVKEVVEAVNAIHGVGTVEEAIKKHNATKSSRVTPQQAGAGYEANAAKSSEETPKIDKKV